MVRNFQIFTSHLYFLTIFIKLFHSFANLLIGLLSFSIELFLGNKVSTGGLSMGAECERGGHNRVGRSLLLILSLEEVWKPISKDSHADFLM